MHALLITLFPRFLIFHLPNLTSFLLSAVTLHNHSGWNAWPHSLFPILYRTWNSKLFCTVILEGIVRCFAWFVILCFGSRVSSSIIPVSYYVFARDVIKLEILFLFSCNVCVATRKLRLFGSYLYFTINFLWTIHSIFVSHLTLLVLHYSTNASTHSLFTARVFWISNCVPLTHRIAYR